MLKRLREDKSLQGTVLASPSNLIMVVLLIVPLFRTLVISFCRRAPSAPPSGASAPRRHAPRNDG